MGKSAGDLFKEKMLKMLQQEKVKMESALTSSINQIMQETSDDYELIYQRCVMKFYSTRAPKRYIRHGMGGPKVKKGINLYNATISTTEYGKFRGNSIITSVDTDRGLYEKDTSYNTSGMEGYSSLSKKRQNTYVDPYVIVSNMMNGIRWPGGLPWLGSRGWSVGSLNVKTSIGTITGGESPIGMLDIYDQLWDKTFMARVTNYFSYYYK